MALDLLAQFEQYQGKIKDYVLSRKEGYFNSDCFEKLEKRYDRLKDCANGNIGYGQWKSKLSFQLVKEQQIIRRALTINAFRNDPLYTLQPINDTSFENAWNMSQVCSMNLKSTEYRRKAWRPTVDFASKFGTSVLYCSYYQKNVTLPRTVTDQTTGLGVRSMVTQDIRQVRHYPVHVLNYAQDPSALNADDSDWQGHIRRWHLSELYERASNSPELYIKENLSKVLEEARNGGASDSDFHVDNEVDDHDDNKNLIDVFHFWGHICLRGNEDDSTTYYCEMVGDKIIRIQADVYDLGLRPYAIFNFDQRFDYWWGNIDAENVLPHENFMNLQLSVVADALLQEQTSRLKFYDEGSIKLADILNKAGRDGWVPYNSRNGQVRPGDLIYQFQNQPLDLAGVDFISREVKESAQRMTTKPDLSRPASMGGFNNSTATAAQIISNQSSIMDADYLESFAMGLQQQAKFDSVALQQFLGNFINLRASIRENQKTVMKSDILGDYSYVVKTSLEVNKQSEAMRKLNNITQLLNFVNSGHPALQGINTTMVIRDWIRDSDMGDVDEIFPEQEQMAVPGAVPTVPGQQSQQFNAIQAQNGGMNAVA